jgi:hypothetical protein
MSGLSRCIEDGCGAQIEPTRAERQGGFCGDCLRRRLRSASNEELELLLASGRPEERSLAAPILRWRKGGSER